MPFAQLGLADDVPYTPGSALVIPFSTVVYQSEAFGGFETLSGVSAFFVPFGAYFASIQIGIAANDGDPSGLESTLQIASASDSDVGGISADFNNAGDGPDRIAVPMSAVRAAGETPIPGHVLPCAVIPVITVVGGSAGNVLQAQTKLLVWKLVTLT